MVILKGGEFFKTENCLQLVHFILSQSLQTRYVTSVFNCITKYHWISSAHIVIGMYGVNKQKHNKEKNKGDVVSFHPTTESNLRTALGVEICKLCIIARIWKPFSDFCSEMGICSDVM